MLPPPLPLSPVYSEYGTKALPDELLFPEFGKMNNVV